YRGAVGVVGHHRALDGALHVQAAAEAHVAADHHARPDQRFHAARAAAALGFLVAEHAHAPWVWAACHGKDCSTAPESDFTSTQTRCGMKSGGTMTLPSSCWKYLKAKSSGFAFGSCSRSPHCSESSLPARTPSMRSVTSPLLTLAFFRFCVKDRKSTRLNSS